MKQQVTKNTLGVAAVLVATLFSIPGVTGPASDEQMADEAIRPYAPGDPVDQAAFLQEHFEKISGLAARSPDAVRPATVFFDTGLSPRELNDLHVNLIGPLESCNCSRL